MVYLRIPSLLKTLGRNSVLAGLTLVYTGGSPQGNGPGFARELAAGWIGGVVPYALLIRLALGTALIVLLWRSVFSRRLSGFGNNRHTAYLAGVAVRGACTLCGIGAGCAASS